MRNKLQFKNFLKRYCKYLTSSCNYRLSSFLKKLDGNYRAIPAVMLYALYYPGEKYFYRNLSDDMKKVFNELLEEFKTYDSVEEMCKLSDNLSSEFKKVYSAYLGVFELKENEKDSKMMYSSLLSELLSNKSVSKYKVCKDNNLYQSNLNKFLHGDLSAVSLDKCRELRTYLDNL